MFRSSGNVSLGAWGEGTGALTRFLICLHQYSYNAGMEHEDHQYTLRSIPAALDQALRARAAQEGKSLNQVAREALKRGIGLPEQEESMRDLDHLIGTWQEDPAFDEAIALQDAVDPEAWR